jgi:hypothetical protein
MGGGTSRVGRGFSLAENRYQHMSVMAPLRQVICPTGSSRMRVMRNLPVVPMCRSRRILIAPPNQRQHPARPALTGGALRDRHER